MKIRIKDIGEACRTRRLTFFTRGQDPKSDTDIVFERVSDGCCMVTIDRPASTPQAKALPMCDIVSLMDFLATSWPELFEVEA